MPVEFSNPIECAEFLSKDITTRNELINKYKNDPFVKIAMVNGKMKQSEVTDIIQRFKNKEFNMVMSRHYNYKEHCNE